MAHHGIGVVASGSLLILACICCSPAEDTSETVEPQRGSSTVALPRQTLDLLAAENYAAVIESFNETMKAAVSATQLKTVWDSVLTQNGAFKSIRSETTAQSGAVETVTFVCDFESGSANVQISVDQNNEVAGLFVRPN